MEYEKHAKRLVLGYLRKECKSAYKVFLKYNFHNQHKHIPTRVAGQTLEDILKIYSRIEEIVQGHLEDTNYYKERTVEFSTPLHLDDQLLYLLDKGRPFTPASTPCPRSPAESSVVESHHENENLNANTSDVETTPEHTLPGNISSHHNNYQSRTPYRKDAKSPSCTTLFMEKFCTSNKESEVPEKTEFQKKLPSNVNTVLNTPDISCYSRREEHEKNKERVGTELDDMLQDFLGKDLETTHGTPMVNTVNKSVSTGSTTSASSNVTHSTTASRNWQHLDEHNNRAVSSILAAKTPITNPTGFLTTVNDNIVYSDNLHNYQDPPVSTAPPVASTSASLPSNQYVLPNSMGMYIVPQPAPTPTAESDNQQQQFYIVNPPVVIPQPAPVMQLLQPLLPAPNKPVAVNSNQKTPLTNDSMCLSEQDIMSMPTIILNERNEVTYADPSCFPNSGKGKEAHDLKEFINLYRPSDQSPIVKLHPPKIVKTKPPIKPTPTIKVEIFQRDKSLPKNVTNANETTGTSKADNAQSGSTRTNTGRIECAGLPNLNDTMDDDSDPPTHEEPSKLTSNDGPGATNKESKISSHEKTKSRVAGSRTPSPLKTTVRKQTPKSGSHVRTLTFPSPKRKTSEKEEPQRSSPRIVNKQHATKDLFGNEKEEEKKTNVKAVKVPQPVKKAKSEEKVAKKSKREPSKSPKKVPEKDKAKSSKKIAKRDVTKKQAEDVISKNSWDANLRKLVVSVVDNVATPVRRASARRKAKQSAEIEISEADGKKLEDALKTPDVEKAKRKTPGRKRVAKTQKNKKLEEELQPEDGETKGETKVLSPSKLNVNKRNILANDVDDVTPHVLKDTSSQYPISSKIRRNITSLLETPVKEFSVPPTPGTGLDATDTPFTPMLRANLKDFTEGDTFSIDTPNFPVTPGLASMVNTSSAYYILNDNENNKVTEATVLQEEKKSSVRKSDDDDDDNIELGPTVYGSKETLENFNKNCVGKKNLELLDNRGVKWDGSSDKEEKSGENSDINTDDESNNTVIQKQAAEQQKEVKRKSLGKCMAKLHSQLVKDNKDQPESFDETLELSSQEDVNTNPQSNEEDKGGGQITKNELKTNKITKGSSSSSDSEVLSKNCHDAKKNKPIIENELPSTDSDLLERNVLENKEINVDTKAVSKIEESSKNIAGDKCDIITMEIRRTIAEVCLENTLDHKSASSSLKAQLEEKKQRLIELDKANATAGNRKTPSRRAHLKPLPNLKTPRSKRKGPSPKRVVRLESNQEKEAPGESKNQCAEATSEVTTECHTVDSQDEFFKKSGTNLHRKNKGNGHTTKTEDDSKKDTGDNIQDRERRNSSTDTTCSENLKCSSQLEDGLEENHDRRKTLKEPVVERNNHQTLSPVQEECDRNKSAEPDNPDEFEKTWDDCNFSGFDAEHVVSHEEESKTPIKNLKDYDFSILQKKIVLGVPCSDGSTVNITLKVSPFESLLDAKPAEECEGADGSRDEVDCSLKRKPDVSDSENPESKIDDVDELKCVKKRKHRSDSCNSNSSAKRMKPSEMINEMTIEKVLFKLHGPNKQEHV